MLFRADVYFQGAWSFREGVCIAITVDVLIDPQGMFPCTCSAFVILQTLSASLDNRKITRSEIDFINCIASCLDTVIGQRFRRRERRTGTEKGALAEFTLDVRQGIELKSVYMHGFLTGSPLADTCRTWCLIEPSMAIELASM